MLRVALCDDETDARDAVRFQLEKIIYEDDEEIVYEFTSGSSAVKWLKAHPGEIDLCFWTWRWRALTEWTQPGK